MSWNASIDLPHLELLDRKRKSSMCAGGGRRRESCTGPQLMAGTGNAKLLNGNLIPLVN